MDILLDILLYTLALRGVEAIIWGNEVPWWPKNRRRKKIDENN